MKLFAKLIQSLENTNKTLQKIEALVEYFEVADNNDKNWVIALFTGKRPKRPVNSRVMREWALEITGLPEWLFVESYSSVGDMGETLSLILPPAENYSDKSLTQWMNEIIALAPLNDEEKKAYVVKSWNELDTTERFIFNKLIGGSFRIGVSQKILITALAQYTNNDKDVLMHSIYGKWDIDTISFEELVSGSTINPDNSKPYPFCLAYPIDKDIHEMGDISEWTAEYKWDGIRGQITKRNGEVFIWSRGEEIVTDQFPELRDAAANISIDFAIDGEILAAKDDMIYNFQTLQQRLNRKVISKKMLAEIPIMFYVYDMLEYEGEDLRSKTFLERREMLEKFFSENKAEAFRLSPILSFDSWDALAALRQGARDINSEGVMLKRKDSIYHSGRKKGDWWKWKIDPLTIDAVMIYAQKGSGRRSQHYTDYTFAVKKGDELVTIAKAYSGLTDKEITEISSFVRKNSIEKFGPVRTVKPELVFELGFEGIGFSKRHKSGVALRFPRILRWRKDKTVDEIDDIDDIKKMITP